MASILKPKPAATLIITKKINNNLCILMGKRPENAKFAPGMWVFPGGKLDKNDIKQNNKYKLNKDIDKETIQNNISNIIKLTSIAQIANK